MLTETELQRVQDLVFKVDDIVNPNESTDRVVLLAIVDQGTSMSTPGIIMSNAIDPHLVRHLLEKLADSAPNGDDYKQVRRAQ